MFSEKFPEFYIFFTGIAKYPAIFNDNIPYFPYNNKKNHKIKIRV